MHKALTLFATAAFAMCLAGAADAAACKDAKGKFTTCPPATATASASYTLDAKGNCHDAKGKMAKKTMCASAATSTTTTAAPASTGAMASSTTTTSTSSGGPKKCVKGKPCGNTCISVKDTCHK